MKFINLTPHTIKETTQGLTIPPSGIVARAKQSTYKVKEHVNCPIYSTEFGGVEGIPAPVEGTIYIVSSLTLQATDRADVVSPGNLQRDEHNNILGCNGFRKK